MNHIFPYKDRINDSELIWESADRIKPDWDIFDALNDQE